MLRNQNEKTESPRAEQELEPCTECEAWRLPVAASTSTD